MDRLSIVRDGISKEMLGVEIGPYHAPLVPKGEGYRCLSLDLHDQAQLRVNAAKTGSIPRESIDRIEQVDLIGSATDLAVLVEEKGLSGQIDYVVSSHNFEHLPNPIEFLNACARVLKTGGFISMAIPDRRGCFDFFRPLATSADFLGAFLARSNKPTLTQLLTHQLFQSCQRSSGKADISSWDWREECSSIFSIADLDSIKQWIDKLPPENERAYMDTHCSSFTRSSFELIIRDLHYMGLIDVGVDQLQGPSGHEFFARLRKGIPIPPKADFYHRRAELLREVIDDAAVNSRTLGELRRSTSAVEDEVGALRQECAALEQKERHLEARLQAVLASNSWRLTAPFRNLGKFMTKTSQPPDR